jgi:hypothetical protein
MKSKHFIAPKKAKKTFSVVRQWLSNMYFMIICQLLTLLVPTSVVQTRVGKSWSWGNEDWWMGYGLLNLEVEGQ